MTQLSFGYKPVATYFHKTVAAAWIGHHRASVSPWQNWPSDGYHTSLLPLASCSQNYTHVKLHVLV